MARNLVVVRHSQPLFPANLCASRNPVFILRRVEKIRHNSVACVARALVVVECDYLAYSSAAEIYGAVIFITMRLLHDNLILFASDPLRHVYDVDVVRILQAGGSGQTDGSRSS